MSGLDSPECPYREGETLAIQLDESFSPSMKSGLDIHLRIIKRFGPVTFSPVLLVEVQETGETLVAKFFDRRYCPGWRKNEKCESWNEKREASFRKFVAEGAAEKFIEQLYDDETDMSDWSWTADQDETHAYEKFREFFDDETRSYHALEWLQGQNIPKLLGTVSFRSAKADKTEHQTFFEVRGALLEYIDGFNLSDLTKNVPSMHWPEIIDDALSIVKAVGALGVHNRDASVYHFLVRSVGEEANKTYQPIMFDFGLSRLREDYDTEEEWMQAKCLQDEEGAIGMIMARRVKHAGGEYDFKKTWPYGAFEGLEGHWRPPRGTFEWRTPMMDIED